MYNKEQLIAFEKKVYDLFEEGDLPYLIHLCGGNEDKLIEIFNDVRAQDWVFSTHRSHYHYLLKGGTERDLLDKIKRGDSMFVFNRLLNFFSSSILAGCAGIAVGVAMALKMLESEGVVYCFIGDGAEDQGHYYEAVRFATSLELPVIFIVEDNDRSVDTTKGERGSDGCFLLSDHVYAYRYKPTYPHASTGSGKIVKFKQEAIDDYLNSDNPNNTQE